MTDLVGIAVAPILVLLIYIYIRDKYEKEPKILCLKCLLIGALSSLPIVYVERLLFELAPISNNYFYKAFYISFVVASFTEETFKYIIFALLIYYNKKNRGYFNEPFDGLVYSAFISLGFALVENILYVLSPTLGGISTGILRSIFSIPAHFIFAIYMGYYFSNNKFNKFNKSNNKINNISLLYAYIVPILVHGVYDLLLFSNLYYIQVLFLLYFIYILLSSIRIIKQFINSSPFKYNNKYID
ncbi:MAG: PrsW family intramembrane metalloprotease [bacterium]